MTQSLTPPAPTLSSANPTSWLNVPDEASLPADIQAIFADQRKKLGLVHPYFKGFSLIPEHLRLWFNYYRELMYGEGELSAKEREIIAVVSSATNHCQSCVTTHKAALREVTGDAAFADDLVTNRENLELTPREQALADFAVLISQLARDLDPSELEPLRAVGLSDRAILEAAEIAAQFGLSNRLTKAFGWQVGPEYDQLFR
ncbi:MULTISPECIES: peroxidase-related enzyme [Cyanophyceae]|uniref:Peroxidase-related enzyme n=1 Tax=Leptolyngbya subtilissima DQ-A4 TaxID=2933933 RepID=A0ABV0KAP6_9CYAN|nr:peroxidase-related enzyme [Nodosilinea sp. FACHB-141]MBD2111802.1 peroxidase-related enzyme [Nodosilinea sp. FACHB-141]